MKALPKEDFRSVRYVLEPGDFAIGSDLPDPPPTDLIPKEIWNHLVGLPDDVAIRTSNEFGAILKDVSEFQTGLLDVSLESQDLATQAGYKAEESPICHVLCSVTDEFAASIYNALTGYYRVAFSALRNVVENLVIGLHLEKSKSDRARFQPWVAGNDELKFGWAADNAIKDQSVSHLEGHLIGTTADNFFRQKAPGDPGGFVRRLFSKLSKFTHGGPGFTDGDLWQSNGPVFVPNVFIAWAVAFIQAYALCLVACRVAQPNLRSLGKWSKLTPEDLFNQAVSKLNDKEDGARLFHNLPAKFW